MISEQSTPELASYDPAKYAELLADLRGGECLGVAGEIIQEDGVFR
ncbi:hypothetical protein [Deinococcus arenicola]|uniref:Uncharacterized protein n=1 Tax=Deinococcus arenicola TaxID=2994950 RepID=A0ABU4DLJ2_9DEIO|nr:hypothetical protein [Deinococcus sp. ZS9-10]MDV6373300.1 hypothetical protein [Deinococcus sp. ZS9-10]